MTSTPYFQKYNDSYYICNYGKLTVTISDVMMMTNRCGIFIRKDRTKISTDLSLHYDFLRKKLSYALAPSDYKQRLKGASINVFAALMFAKKFIDDNFEINYSYIKSRTDNTSD